MSRGGGVPMRRRRNPVVLGGSEEPARGVNRRAIIDGQFMEGSAKPLITRSTSRTSALIFSRGEPDYLGFQLARKVKTDSSDVGGARAHASPGPLGSTLELAFEDLWSVLVTAGRLIRWAWTSGREQAWSTWERSSEACPEDCQDARPVRSRSASARHHLPGQRNQSLPTDRLFGEHLQASSLSCISTLFDAEDFLSAWLLFIPLPRQTRRLE